MKILKRGKVENYKKTINVICKECSSELEIKKRNLSRNMQIQIPIPGIGCYAFKCPVCKKWNSTTNEQEHELGLKVQ